MSPDARILTDFVHACGILSRRAVQEQAFGLSDHLVSLITNLPPFPPTVPPRALEGCRVGRFVQDGRIGFLYSDGMTLKLGFIGIVTKNMADSLAFYRKLGVPIAPDQDDAPHVEAAFAELTGAASTSHGAPWDAHWGQRVDGTHA